MYPQTGLKLPPEPVALLWPATRPDQLCQLPYSGMTEHRHGALDKQIGGTHYKDLPIQPVEFIHKNGIGFIAGNVIKYVCRYRTKGGTADLLKAKHYIEMLIEQERQDP